MSSASSSRCCVVVIVVVISFAILAYALYLSQTTRPAADTTPAAKPGPRAVSSLRFVIVITRHGNRRPLFSFPNDPYPDKYWSCELGEVTKQGKVEMYKLGMKVRSLYNGFLDSIYSSNDLYATSTALERTLVSAEAFLAGLYPPMGFQIWNEKIPWQPIPIFTDSPDGSQINNYPCPRYQSETLKCMAEYQEKNTAVITEVNDYLANYTGYNSSQDHLLYRIWDTLLCEEIEGFVLPEWINQVYPNPLNDLISQQFVAVSAGTDAVTRIICSALLNQSISLMESKINNTLSPDYKMYYYSAHDMTIIGLQGALGIPKSSIIGLVNPGSAMIYELHQDPSTNNHYVQVLYIDGLSDLEPLPINIPDCGLSCDFNQLLHITTRFRNFTSEEDECFKTE